MKLLKVFAGVDAIDPLKKLREPVATSDIFSE